MKFDAVKTSTGVRGGGLLWTDWWYLAATVAAAVVAVDPLQSDLTSDARIKHLALIISLPAFLMVLAGSSLYSRTRDAGSMAPLGRTLWPLLALAAFALGGSLYARFFLGIQNSFMNVGLYMLTAYFAAAVVLRTGDAGALVRAHVRILFVAALVMGVYLIVNFRVRQVYHEQIFLVIPMAVLCLASRGWALARWAGGLFFLAMAWLSAKYTSYLIGVVTCAYLTLAVVIPRMAPRRGVARTMLVYWACLLAAIVGVLAGLYALSGDADLPTGNVEYRTHTYLAAWDRFLGSPLWGTGFAVEAVEKFTLYSIGISDNMLATHSDVMDLLANGGLLGVVLWLYALARIARAARVNLLGPERLDGEWAPYAHTLAVMSLAGIITYAFNPILLQPALAYLIWTNLGLLAGLALRAQTGEFRAEEFDRMAARRRAPGVAYGAAAGSRVNARAGP